MGEGTLAGDDHFTSVLLVEEPGQLCLHSAQEPEALVVLAFRDVAEARRRALGPVEAVHAEVVLPVRTADLLTSSPDHRLDPVRIVPGACRELRHAREKACRSGELALCTDRAGELLPHGGVAVPEIAQRVLGGLRERRVGRRVEAGSLGGVHVLDEPGHVLRTLAQGERGVQFTEDLFAGGRRHGPHPDITTTRSPLLIRVRGPVSAAVPRSLLLSDAVDDAGPVVAAVAVLDRPPVVGLHGQWEREVEAE
jgi:hypothetical protein